MTLATNRNVRTAQFKSLYDGLPDSIQRLGVSAYRQFKRDPYYYGLHLHELTDMKRGRHRLNSWSVWINREYRAIFVVDGETNVWYWVGSHSDYNTFTGKC